MGYESKLYVVEKSTIIDNNKRWGQVIAMIDMSKLGQDFFLKLKNYSPTDCYIYLEDEEVTEDKYGDPLIEIPIKDMIAILAEMASKEDYRRLTPAINLLLGFNLSEWNELVVLHYGY